MAILEMLDFCFLVVFGVLFVCIHANDDLNKIETKNVTEEILRDATVTATTVTLNPVTEPTVLLTPHTEMIQAPVSVAESEIATTAASATKERNDALNEIEDIDDDWTFENKSVADTRRILYGKRVQPGKRAYMVYLQLTKDSAKAEKYRGWLCGGAIVHRNYVLTSAACVQDADHFYVVSGTTRYVETKDYKSNDCVCKHRRKVVWKCVPKNYKFDFQDSVKWSSNDIAIVKVNKPFKLGEIEKGCEFAAELVLYNNISRELECAGTKGFIAGWGSDGGFREGVYRRKDKLLPRNAKCLQEAKVCIMDNERCTKKWSQKFKDIIKQYMICTKDVTKRLSEICDKKYANCTDVEDVQRRSKKIEQPKRTLNIDLGRHLSDPDDYTARRSTTGGFCENDHGGPLIVKYNNCERVIGVISACKIDPKSHSCHGPFLYTSVFVNRQFISCSIHKDVEDGCRRVFRAGLTHEEWPVDWAGVDEDDDDDDDGIDSSSDDNGDGDEKEKKKDKKKKKKDIVRQLPETAIDNKKEEKEDIKAAKIEDKAESKKEDHKEDKKDVDKEDRIEESKEIMKGDKKEVKKKEEGAKADKKIKDEKPKETSSKKILSEEGSEEKPKKVYSNTATTQNPGEKISAENSAEVISKEASSKKISSNTKRRLSQHISYDSSKDIAVNDPIE